MKRTASLVVTAIFLLGLVFRLSAHGGGELVVRSEETGPFKVSVWINPPDPRVGAPLHFTVGLASPVDNSPILDANVFIEMRQEGEGRPVYSGPATTDQSINKLFYESDLEIPDIGLYVTTISISNATGGGEINFSTTVKEAGRLNWMIWGFAGLALVLIFGLWRSRMSSGKDSQVN